MLSIIIPAHNEALRIGYTLEEYSRYFSSRYGNGFEIIVVTNHCRDNTHEIVEQHRDACSCIRLHIIDERGKGRALRAGFTIAKGDLVAFSDADGATKPEELDKLILQLTRYDGAIASRWLPQSVTLPRQGFSRRAASRVWNLLVRLVLGLPYTDTQCGAKAFRRTTIESINHDLMVDGFACDIELLYKMKLNDRQIKELPINWNNYDGSTLNLIRCAPEMLWDLIRLKKLK